MVKSETNPGFYLSVASVANPWDREENIKPQNKEFRNTLVF